MTPAALTRTTPIPPLRLTPTDEEMLEACARYQYLTHEHWCRSFKDDGKLRYIQRRSREMTEHNFLTRLYITRPGSTGKAPSLFTLGPAGRHHVASLGIRVPQRFRRSDLTSLSPKHLAHSEELTDVLLSFDLLARHDDRITITELLHERFLFEQRFKVPVRSVDALTGQITDWGMEVTPDALVRVSAQAARGLRRFPILVEVDRDTEQQVVFREKVSKLYAFGASETYERLYEARSFNVAFFVRAPKRDPLLRLAEVMTWTERELRQHHLEHEAAAFSFCALDPATTNPTELLLGANWLHPFSTTPHALIDLSDTEGGA